MNICFVYDCEYPWDIRVEKICKSLINDSHDVSLICRNNNAESEYSQKDSLKIYRLPKLKYGKITKLVNITFFFNPFWLYKIFRIVRKNKCRLILVRDLPLALSGILVGKLTKIPVIIDMAEPYPLTVRQRRQFEPFSLFHIITRNIFFADFLEKITLKTANHIFTVCEEARNRLLKLGAVSRNVSIVRNTPELKKIQITPPKYPGIMSKLKNEFIVLYVGIIIGGRGIDIAIKAFKEIAERRTDIKLVVVGNGKMEKAMRDLAQELKLEDTVFFEGWVNSTKVPEYINSCDLGLLPFMNSQHINHTIANKLFDFMVVGKPVLCSDVKPMKRIVNETKANYLFKAEDFNNLKDELLEIARNSDLAKLGKSGIKFAQSKYNWQVDSNKMLEVVDRIIKNNV